MFCIHCGKKITDDSKFCVFCGKVISENVKETEDFGYFSSHQNKEPNKEWIAQNRSKGFMNDKEKKMIDGQEKSRKKAILISSLTAFLILVLGISFVLINGKIKKDRYEEAVVFMEHRKFTEAKELLEKLKGYKDSKDRLQECQNNLDYERALSLLEGEEYEKARDEFEKLGNFKESKEKYKLCIKGIDYNEAVRLRENNEYSRAIIIFESLGDFKDSATRLQVCRNHLDYEKAEELLKAKKYKEAEPLYSRLSLHDFEDSGEKYLFCLNKEKMKDAKKNFKKRKYYTAYKLFKDLGDFEDADKKMKDCIKKYPGTKELYRNKKYKNNSLSLQIVPPKDGSRNIIKIYNKNNEKVSLITISKNSNYTVRLPEGSYRIKNGYGYDSNEWFGEKELFGEEGYYFTITNNDYTNEIFALKRGYIYTLTLRSKTKGKGKNVYNKTESLSKF